MHAERGLLPDGAQFEVLLPRLRPDKEARRLAPLHDLSNNALTPKVSRYLLESLRDNIYMSELNLHGNRLNDVFAAEFASLLQVN